MAEVWGVLWKQGENLGLFMPSEGKPWKIYSSKEKTRLVYSCTFCLSRIGKRLFFSEYADIFHLLPPNPLHTHSPAFSSLSCRRACVNCSIRFSCAMVSVGFSQWGDLAGEIWGKEESKTRVCIFSAPSLWLCPSLEGHSPSVSLALQA